MKPSPTTPILALFPLLLALSAASADGVIQNGSFETGDYTGWNIVSGTAFGAGPIDERVFPSIEAWEGRYYVNTFWAGETATGVLRSDPFTLNGPVFFLLGGHNHWPGEQPPFTHNYVALRRVADGVELDRVWAPGSNTLSPAWLFDPGAVGQEVVIDIVDDGDAGGFAWIAADFFVQPGAPRPDGGFESGTYGEWVATGTAWGAAPTGAGSPGPLSGWEGGFFASTHADPAASGSLRSPEFTVRGSISLLVAGQGSGTVSLRNAADGALLDQVTAPASDAFRPVRLSAPGHSGQRAYLEAVDPGAGWLAIDAADLPAGDLSHGTSARSWTATDSFGRTLPTHEDVGPLRDDRFVGMFYFTWHAYHQNWGVWDVTKITDAVPYSPSTYPTVEAYLDELENHLGEWKHPHWWGRPVFGYYDSRDPYVLRKHLQMLADAGVDVLIMDATNGFTYFERVLVLMAVAQQMRNEGLATPDFAFLARETEPGDEFNAAESIYADLYEPGFFPDLWFRWQGKPLMLVFDALNDGINLPQEMDDFFTYRESWAFSTGNASGDLWWGDGQRKWAWIDEFPQEFGWDEDPSVPEAMPASIAQHVHTNIGRSYQYLDGGQPPFGEGSPWEGPYFAEQVQRPLTLDPEFVFITGWNEWVAGRWRTGEDGFPAELHQMGVLRGPGKSAFIDAFNDEFNRDMEPADAEHGDAYYYQLADFIRRFKGAPAPQAPTPPFATRDINDFADWDAIRPVYRDTVGDPARRNEFPGFGALAIGPYEGPYTNLSGRNDIIEARVALDLDHVYFWARCARPITPRTDPDWMQLYINADADPQTGWEGYDFVVNRTPASAATAQLEANVGGAWQWQPAGQVAWRVSGREIQIAVPRATLGVQANPVEIEFKWFDGAPVDGDVIRFTTHGDAAPNDRFNYRYRGAEGPAATVRNWGDLSH